MGTTNQDPIKRAIRTLKKVQPHLDSSKQELIAQVIMELEGNGKSSSKPTKADWVIKARLLLLAAEIIRFFRGGEF